MLKTMIIEIPVGSNIKYEIKTDELWVDRILPVFYPFHYGFYPNTLAEDGDALDAVLILQQGVALLPGSHVKVKPIGIVEMTDAGVQDNKIVCVLPHVELGHDERVEIIKHLHKFFQTYKVDTDVERVYLRHKDESTQELDKIINDAEHTFWAKQEGDKS